MVSRVSIRDAFLEALDKEGFKPDAAQLRAADRLEDCAAQWANYRARRGGRLKKMVSAPPLPLGVYLWGGVGRGKSYLMDLFFKHVPLERKVRLHFHEFMRTIHRGLHELRGIENPLDEVARRVAQRYRLICFDEFHISDIADAMILDRLLGALIGNRVGFIMTSNYHPDQLYPEGLHRDRLLPAIALIKQHLDVVELNGDTDYRQLAQDLARTYLYPLNVATAAEMGAAFARLSTAGAVTDAKLEIEAREIRAVKRSGQTIWFDFKTLCGGPRSQNDYLELASQFRTVLLSDVPQMSAGMSSEARRFTWLVDVLYDHKVKLIISAEVPPEALYTAGVLANEFKRTVSRLTEMQSQAYRMMLTRSEQAGPGQ